MFQTKGIYRSEKSGKNFKNELKSKVNRMTSNLFKARHRRLYELNLMARGVYLFSKVKTNFNV